MKKCKVVTGWTDYPFVSLGDLPGKKAPIRHVKVLSYDGDKYIKLEFLDPELNATLKAHGLDCESMKTCYLYRHPGRCGMVKQISQDKLLRMGDGKQARKHRKIREGVLKDGWTISTYTHKGLKHEVWTSP